MARCSVQPVAMSTQSMVLAYIPSVELPQWATVSASRKPGRDSSHWLVFTGICFLKSVPGLVVALPHLVYCARTGFSIRSMLDGDILSKATAVCSEIGP